MKQISPWSTPTEIENYAFNIGQDVDDVKHAQAMYLYHNRKEPRKEIAYVMQLNPDTLSRWKNKYLNLLPLAIVWFHNTLYISNRTKSIIQATQNGAVKGNWCYVVQFYYNGQPSFTKIGTTVRPLHSRLSEEARDYNKTGTTPVDGYPTVIAVYDCGNLPAQTVESGFRWLLARKYPTNYVENDRFVGIFLTQAQTDKMYNYIINGAPLGLVP